MQKENYTRYMMVGLLLTLALVASLGMAFTSEDARMEKATTAQQKASILRGRQLYVDNCTSCHGTRGEGNVGPALNNITLLKKAPDEVLFAAIVAGRPSTVMPAWGQDNGGPFTNEEIHDIVTFIRAWEPNAPEVQAVAFVPSPARGAAIYASSCFVCHGEDGKGEIAPAINDQARLGKLEDDWYRQTIINGRPAKGMPTWGTVLSPNQVEDVVAMIAAWRKGERVVPEITVAELLNSSLFSLSQGDSSDALFYIERARSIAFGPALSRFDPIIADIQAEQLDTALAELGNLTKDWPIGEAVNGETIFMDTCKGCHGSEGQGGVGLKLKPNVFVQSSTNSELLIFLLTGRTGTAMRSFDGILSESQLADVIAFLRTWQP